MNASIIGENGEDLFRGDDPSFVDIQLLKANTFYSQWCDRDAQESDFQVASVRPSRNLFRDPDFFEGNFLNGPWRTLGVRNETNLDSIARIQAPFNISRDEFSNDEYENGNTSELAARGLYGEYTLVFPAGILSLPTRSGVSDGLELRAVEDILLRLDYVSTAR